MIKGNMRGADIKDDKREYEKGGYHHSRKSQSLRDQAYAKGRRRYAAMTSADLVSYKSTRGTGGEGGRGERKGRGYDI